MKTALITIVILALGVWAVVALTDDDDVAIESPTPSVSQSTTPSGTGAMTKEFDLKEQNDSNQEGTVTLTALAGGRTRVDIVLNNAPTTAEPAHIHVGACPSPGVIKYSLSNVVSGRSTTTLNVPFDTFKTLGALAVNVHKSAAELNVYMACTDLKF